VLDAFQIKQAFWLEAERKLSESAVEPQRLTHQIAEIDALASLAKEVDLDDRPLHALAAEAVKLGAEADRVKRTVAFARGLADAFGIETPIQLQRCVSS
ncbi:MAG: hypothetical protein ACREF8_06195, partial [Chthoniobacterales bacterium]